MKSWAKYKGLIFSRDDESGVYLYCEKHNTYWYTPVPLRPDNIVKSFGGGLDNPAAPFGHDITTMRLDRYKPRQISLLEAVLMGWYLE